MIPPELKYRNFAKLYHAILQHAIRRCLTDNVCADKRKSESPKKQKKEKFVANIAFQVYVFFTRASLKNKKCLTVSNLCEQNKSEKYRVIQKAL